MPSSMTAFARVQGDGYTWEIRSVNHRGLDIQIRVPESLQINEHEIRDAISEKIARGRVDITYKPNSLGTGSSETVEANVIELAQSLKKVTHLLPDNVTPMLEISRVFTLADRLNALNNSACSDFDEEMEKLHETITQFLQDRHREGEELKSVLVDRVRASLELVTRINSFGEEQTQLIQKRIQDRIDSLGVTVDEARIAQEVALQAQKADIDEETERLSVHLKEFLARLEDPGPTGRRLNFLTQEMAREANTLASKAYTPECASLVVDLKVFIDQVREQVQNIE